MTERIAEKFEVFVVSYFLLRRYPQGKRETMHLAYGNRRDLLRSEQALESLNLRENMVVKILERMRFSRNLADLDRIHVDVHFSEIVESGKRHYLVCWVSWHGFIDCKKKIDPGQPRTLSSGRPRQ